MKMETQLMIHKELYMLLWLYCKHLIQKQEANGL